MRRALRFFFQHNGTLARAPFLAAGVGLFSIKYAIDAVLVAALRGLPWRPWDYLNLRWRDVDLNSMASVQFACIMVAAAMPFVWAGIALTLKRLRSAGWSSGLVWLFFIPYVNAVFFLLLAAAPAVEQSSAPPPAETDALGPLTGVKIFIVTLLLALLVVTLAAYVKSYGLGLFIGLPFMLGFLPGILYRCDGGVETTLRQSLRLTIIIQAVLAATLLAFAIEGLFCILMAAPLSIAISALGVVAGRSVRSLPSWLRPQKELGSFVLLLLLPLFILAETGLRREPSLFPVTTAIEVNAPREKVWNNVISFSDLPLPSEWYFRGGIAYPIKAEIQGTGPGAMRYCIFSTGAFVEPITIWQEPELLKFEVMSNPPPMREWSPFPIEPPHLEGFMISQAGQFKLTAMESGRTLLEGTTWYQHSLWPEWYWRLWSDAIIHRIHLRVLRHIQHLSERTESKGSRQ